MARRPKPKPRASPDPDFADLLAALNAEVARSASRLADGAALLEAAGNEAIEAVAQISRHAAPRDLLLRQYRLRAVVLQSLHALLELQLEAGKLSALAALREAGEA